MSDISLVPVGKMFSEPEATDKYCMAVTEGTGDASDLTELIGALTRPTTSVTATSYTVLAADACLLVDDDTAGGAVTIALLAASTAGDGYSIEIKKLGTTANVILDGSGSETIDGATTATLTSQYEAVKLRCDGTSYHIF
jgi:hypothetical protein